MQFPKVAWPCPPWGERCSQPRLPDLRAPRRGVRPPTATAPSSAQPGLLASASPWPRPARDLVLVSTASQQSAVPHQRNPLRGSLECLPLLRAGVALQLSRGTWRPILVHFHNCKCEKISILILKSADFGSKLSCS